MKKTTKTHILITTFCQKYVTTEFGTKVESVEATEANEDAEDAKDENDSGNYSRDPYVSVVGKFGKYQVQSVPAYRWPVCE